MGRVTETVNATQDARCEELYGRVINSQKRIYFKEWKAQERCREMELFAGICHYLLYMLVPVV